MCNSKYCWFILPDIFSFHRIMPISWSMFILWLLKFQNLGYHRRTLVGLWINLAVGERWVSSFFLLHVDIQFFNTIKDDMRPPSLRWSFKGLSKSVAVALKICYCVLYTKTPIYNSGFVLPPAVSNAMAPRCDMKFGFVLLPACLLFTVSITALLFGTSCLNSKIALRKSKSSKFSLYLTSKGILGL